MSPLSELRENRGKLMRRKEKKTPNGSYRFIDERGSQRCLMERRRETKHLDGTGALRSKRIESATKERLTCLRRLFFRFDLCNLIRAKTIHVVQPAL